MLEWGGGDANVAPMTVMKLKQLKIEADSNDIFVVLDGVKIAKRGQPGTPYAKAWISLEPGWSVLDREKGVEISYQASAARVH